jgi:hypothetical protein
LALVAVVLLFAFQPRLNRALGLAKVIRKIKAAGVEFEINAEAVDAVRAYLNASVGELVAKARDEYDRMAHLMRMPEHLKEFVTKASSRALASKNIQNYPRTCARLFMCMILFSSNTYTS